MEKGGGQLVDAPSFVDICTLGQHAMRYYRLWIYACNTVLALATLIFTSFALAVFLDPRISLLSGVELYQPTFLYAYTTLIFQCGILQAIGCVGALRLNPKLLNTYWTLLFILMIGDIFVGLVWAFRLDRIKSNLKPNLKERLISEYGNDTHFTQTWDWVQKNDICCGVEGPADFIRQFNDSSPNHVDGNGQPLDILKGLHHPKLPSTCCVFTITQHFPTSSSSWASPPPFLSNIGRNNVDSSKSGGQKGHNVTPTTGGGGYQQRTNRIQHHPHYPNSNFTMHLSSFGSGSGTHNRRKVIQTHRHDPDKTDPSQASHTNRGNVQTTTESSNRRSRTPYGVCGLPPELLAKHKLSNIYIKVSDTIVDSYSFESGSGGGSSGGASTSSSEESFTEIHNSIFSSTSSSVLESTSSTWTKVASVVSSKSSSSPPSSSSGDEYSSSPPSSTTTLPPYVLVAMTLNNEGCSDKILEWVDHSSDLLFVIGFCIIVFLKGSFVAILRYEIKEMIQKIKLLNGEDEGRTAAMNELIGLTSMYERGENFVGDPGEREGLMASSGSGGHGGPGDSLINTNLDTMESDVRKDSVISRDNHNCIGNNIGNCRKASVPFTNHISISSNNSAPATTVVAMVGVSSRNPQQHHRQETDIDDDFDSGSALLARPREELGNIRKFKNENGGRSLPRNGNNNTTGIGGVTGSASAPIPIDSMAKT